MIALVNFVLFSRLGQLAAGGLLFVGMFAAWLMSHDAKVAARTSATIVEASKEAGRKANAKNDVVRRDAAKPGAAERLLRDACRDCAGIANLPRLAAPDRQQKRQADTGNRQPDRGQQQRPAKLGLSVRDE